MSFLKKVLRLPGGLLGAGDGRVRDQRLHRAAPAQVRRPDVVSGCQVRRTTINLQAAAVRYTEHLNPNKYVGT